MKYLKLIFCLTSRQLNKFSETCFYSYHYDFTGLRFQKPTITVCTQNDRAFLLAQPRTIFIHLF